MSRRSFSQRLERLENAANAARRVVRTFADFFPVFKDRRAHAAFYDNDLPPEAPQGLEPDDLEKYAIGRKLRAGLAKFYPPQDVDHG